MEAQGGRPQRRTKAGRLVSTITRQELEACFHLPSEQACRRLGVGLTILKRVCRRFGIPRWPYNRQGRQDDGSGDSNGLFGAHPGGNVYNYSAPQPPIPTVMPPPSQQQPGMDWQQQLQAALAGLLPQEPQQAPPAQQALASLGQMLLGDSLQSQLQGQPQSGALQNVLAAALGGAQAAAPVPQWGAPQYAPPGPLAPAAAPPAANTVQQLMHLLQQHPALQQALLPQQQAPEELVQPMASVPAALNQSNGAIASLQPAASLSGAVDMGAVGGQPSGPTAPTSGQATDSSLDLLMAAADNNEEQGVTAPANVARPAVDSGEAWQVGFAKRACVEDAPGGSAPLQPLPVSQPQQSGAAQTRHSGTAALAALLSDTQPVQQDILSQLMQKVVPGEQRQQQQQNAAAAASLAVAPVEPAARLPVPVASAPARPGAAPVGDLERQLLAALPSLSDTAALLRKAAHQLQAHLMARKLLKGEAAALVEQMAGSSKLAGTNAELAEVCTSTLLSILEDGTSNATNGASQGPALTGTSDGAPAPGTAMQPGLVHANCALEAQPQQAAPAAAAKSKSKGSAELSKEDSSDMEEAQSEPAAAAGMEDEVPRPHSAPPMQ